MSQAQVMHGGHPVGLSDIGLKSARLSGFELPPIGDRLQIKAVDPNSIHHKTLKFAHTFKVNLNPENSGRWSTLNDGSRVWRLSIKSAGAKSLNIIFNKYHIPGGAQVFVYSPDMTHVLGAFTNANNKSSGILPVSPIIGDELIVEYKEPAGAEFYGELEIGKVNHDYLGINTLLKATTTGNFGSSQACEVNSNCEDGFENEKRSVVKMIVDGNELCSGALINNTSQNGRALVLSAAHCFKDHNFNAAGTIFIFNYEVPGCFNNIEGSREQSVAGGTLLAYSEVDEYQNSDYALVEMSIKPPQAYRPYYCGWDASAELNNNVVSIHHPNGDVKKISRDADEINTTTLVVQDFVYRSFSPWNIYDWDSGVTEGGSLGCPLFDQNGRILGALSAGQASCDNPVNDFYFNLKQVWTAHSNPGKTLKYFLDPGNTGTRIMDGLYPSEYKYIERITNLKKDEDIETVSLGSSGYQTGFNSNNGTGFAEHYQLDDTCKLYGFYFVPSLGNISSMTNIQFKIWEGGTSPGNEIWSKTVNIKEWGRTQTVTTQGDSGGYKLKIYYDDKENFVALEKPIYAGKDFYIGFSITGSSTVDTLAIYQAKDRGNTSANTAYFYRNNSWSTYPNYTENAVSTSLFIDPVVKIYKNTSDTTIPTYRNKIISYIEPLSAIGNYFTFHFAEPLKQTSHITVYTLNGQRQNSWLVPVGAEAFDANFSGLASGVYLVKIQQGTNSEVQRLVNVSF